MRETASCLLFLVVGLYVGYGIGTDVGERFPVQRQPARGPGDSLPLPPPKRGIDCLLPECEPVPGFHFAAAEAETPIPDPYLREVRVNTVEINLFADGSRPQRLLWDHTGRQFIRVGTWKWFNANDPLPTYEGGEWVLYEDDQIVRAKNLIYTTTEFDPWFHGHIAWWEP